jgi:hypothetical protein
MSDATMVTTVVTHIRPGRWTDKNLAAVLERHCVNGEQVLHPDVVKAMREAARRLDR